MTRNVFRPMAALFVCFAWAAICAADERPNILIFYLDDMGWAQPGCYGGKLAPTPNLDALAAGGARCTNGYVSACVCGPSRVGLMTGRYQARTGHDSNGSRGAAGNRSGRELLLSETTLGQRFKSAGYRTGIVGKWHLGDGPSYLPASRGFDYSVGSLDNLGEGKGPAFYREHELLEELEGEPITSPFYAKEACGFIEREKDHPWALTVAFNAVHTPHVASEKWLEKFSKLPAREQKYAALLAEADEAIGTVMTKLKELKQDQNTLVFCIADNGGAAPQAEMGGLRGRKWFVWEGGIRVPWIASWPGHIPAGGVIEEPVIQLDVLPTALAAAGVATQPDWQLDGVNLLPLLEGKDQTLERGPLFFRFGVQYAVRQGDWKLVKASLDMEPMLVNLATDPGEQHDLSAEQPQKKQELQALYDAWDRTMQPPRWVDQRWNGEENRKQNKAGEKPRKPKM